MHARPFGTNAHFKDDTKKFSDFPFLISFLFRPGKEAVGMQCSAAILCLQLLDMKLLFIITILCADTRSHFRNDLHAIQDLCVMATMLTSTVSSRRKSNNSTNTVTSPEEGQAANIVCEILKVLFNLVCNISTTNLTLVSADCRSLLWPGRKLLLLIDVSFRARRWTLLIWAVWPGSC